MASRDKQPEPAPEPEIKTFAVGRDESKIDGIYRGRDHRHGWDNKEYAKLELAEQKRPVAAPEPQLPRRTVSRKNSALLVTGIVVGSILFAVVAIAGVRAVRTAMNRGGKSEGLLIVDSVPSNARLFLNGVEVGRTPYVAPNTYPRDTQIQARIVYPGAVEWTGTFPGGVSSTFTAELQSAQQ